MASIVKPLSQVLNPLAIPVAGSGVIPVWGVVRHTGRRSGRSYATPVALAATGDFFFIPLPYGAGTDWCRNVLAARRGTVRYRGHEYDVSDPRVVDASEARRAFPALVRPLIGILRITRFLRVER